MTNFLRAPMLEGFEKRAASVLKQCEASRGGYLDVYVWALSCNRNTIIRLCIETESHIGHPALLCIGLRFAFSVQSWRNRYFE